MIATKRKHDFTSWTKEDFFLNSSEEGMVLTACYSELKVGDLVLLPVKREQKEFRVCAIEYYAAPRGMFMALLEEVPCT